MLDLNPETVRFIIERAQEFQVDDDLELPEDEAEAVDAIDEDEPPVTLDDPIYEEVRTAIEDLEPDQQISLVALMWLGRGDYTPDEWDRVLEMANESWNERSAEYLIRTPLLADYLSEGLELLGHADDETD